ncbi:MAG: DUF3617 domain-containing protein [Pseudomonadota bacterium]|nr:DUF3617 domain-containing protein [Pseudomonadota bacterium]
MKAISGITAFSALAGLALALSSPAQAAHGKVGLWNVTVTMGGPVAPEIPAAARTQMKTHGIGTPNDHTISAQHCMTAAEVASDRLTLKGPTQQSCSLTDLKTAGHTLTGRMVCTGEMKGEGRIAITYDTPEHYSGKMDFNGSAGERPLHMSYRYEGRWRAADCGNVKN